MLHLKMPETLTIEELGHDGNNYIIGCRTFLTSREIKISLYKLTNECELLYTENIHDPSCSNNWILPLDKKIYAISTKYKDFYTKYQNLYDENHSIIYKLHNGKIVKTKTKSIKKYLTEKNAFSSSSQFVVWGHNDNSKIEALKAFTDVSIKNVKQGDLIVFNKLYKTAKVFTLPWKHYGKFNTSIAKDELTCAISCHEDIFILDLV